MDQTSLEAVSLGVLQGPLETSRVSLETILGGLQGALETSRVSLETILGGFGAPWDPVEVSLGVTEHPLEVSLGILEVQNPAKVMVFAWFLAMWI